MKGNLLIDIDSFRWENLAEDRNEYIESFGLALNLARDEEKKEPDLIYLPSKIWDISLSWGRFHEILYWEEEERKQKMPWLTTMALTTLNQLLTWFPSSEYGSETLADLNEEFKGELNGLLGLPKKAFINPNCVYDEQTWYHWHRSYFILNPPLRSEFCISLSNYFPNLYLNESSVKPGLAGLHADYRTIMATILYHLALLNDVYYPKFVAEPTLGGDGVCDYLQEYTRNFCSSNCYRSCNKGVCEYEKKHTLKLNASRDGSGKKLYFEFKDIKTKEIKKLYCDLHTKFADYFEYEALSYQAKGNRLYFHQPIENFLEGKLLIARIGEHA